MSRTARRERKRGATEARRARAGRLGLQVEATGDLETGAHHTVEDVGIVLGQALDEALGDRAGIRRYGSPPVPVDEGLAPGAVQLSRPPPCRPPRSAASTPSWPTSSSAPSPPRRS